VVRSADSWSKAKVTLGLCALIATCWLVASLLGLDVRAALWGGFIPARVTMSYDGSTAPAWLTPLTATLVQGGLIHLAYNTAVLAFSGRQVENVLGPVSVAILFVLGAYAAAAADYLLVPQSSLPMIGASGAVSAIVGAYAILFGRNRIGVLRGRIAVWLNALWLLAAWLVVTLMVFIVTSENALGWIGLPLVIFAAIHSVGFTLGALIANPLLLIRYRKA